jgi:hypothetical protein
MHRDGAPDDYCTSDVSSGTRSGPNSDGPTGPYIPPRTYSESQSEPKPPKLNGNPVRPRLSNCDSVSVTVPRDRRCQCGRRAGAVLPPGH